MGFARQQASFSPFCLRQHSILYMTFTQPVSYNSSGHKSSSSHHVNVQHIPARTHAASLAERSTTRLLSASWITTLFQAAAADILPPVSYEIRWNSVLPGCPALTDLMTWMGLGECATWTEWGRKLESEGLWAAESCSTKTLLMSLSWPLDQ